MRPEAIENGAKMGGVPFAWRFRVALVDGWEVPGQNGMGAGEVSRIVVIQGPDERNPVGQAREAGKVFTELDSRRGGCDRAKGAADFIGRFGLRSNVSR